MKELILNINSHSAESDALTTYFLENVNIHIIDSKQTTEDITFVMSNDDEIKLNIDCEFFNTSTEIEFVFDLWNFYKSYNTEFFKRVVFYYFEDLSLYYKYDDVLEFDPIKIVALLNDNK